MSSLRVESLRRIEAICSSFEARVAVQREPIAPYLLQLHGQERSELLRELVAIDIEYRMRRGESPSADDYLELTEECTDGTSSATLHRLIEQATQQSDERPTSERYDFIEKVGTGGNGEVWRVYDYVSQRTLAIKLLRSDPHDHRDADARLEREALVTGKLQHPGIPPIYERGCLSDGTPYFSMKLIRGQTFEKIIHEKRAASGIERSLGIFEQLTQAVAYAHSQGVIHRDLKPRNVMVGAFGEVQVMDWGLAKRLDGGRVPTTTPESNATRPHATDVESQTTIAVDDTRCVSDDESWEEIRRSLTVAGVVMGTPAYMSPEQARGQIELLDRRTDVFTLGAILFEILTGETLHTNCTAAEAIRRTAFGEYWEATERLQERDDYLELRKLCRDCLRFDPEQRPASANVVADAVADYLVSAERRARQAELDCREADLRAAEDRRHRRLQTRTAVVVALVSSVGAAAAGWQWHQASKANQRTAAALSLADQRLEQAQTVVDEFLTEVADQGGLLATAPGAQPVRRKLLEKARDYYEGFLREAGDDRQMQLEVAKAYSRLGDIALIIDPTGEDLVTHRNKVIEICDRMLEVNPRDADFILVRSLSYRAIGQSHYFAKQHQEAKVAHLEAKRGFSTLTTLRGNDEDYRELAKVCQFLGSVLYELRELNESERELAESLAHLEKASTDLSNDIDAVRQMRAIHRSVGIVQGWGRGNWELCCDSFEKALELSTRAAELRPDQFSFLDDVATDEMNLAMACNHIKAFDRAERGFRECIRIREQLSSENPTVADFRRALAQAYGNFSTYLWWRNQPALSAELSDKSRILYDEMVADQPAVDAFRVNAEQADVVYASMRMRVDHAEGLSESDVFERAQPTINRMVSRRARYTEEQPHVAEHSIYRAYYACFRDRQPPPTLLEWTADVDGDPKQVSRRNEFWIATRALAYIRNERHDEAARLFAAYPKELDRTISRFVKCLALVPSAPDQAQTVFDEAVSKWNQRKNPEFDFYMLHAEAKQALAQ